MPRRTLTPATPAPPPLPAVLPKDPAQLELSDPEWAANLRLLRRHWKWAAFSQFFYTFAPLFAMNDVTLVDIEDDLARGVAIYLPRIMTRLLYTLTQDRKISIDNWQTALRKQYMRRDPAANPIGPEPPTESRQPTRELSEPSAVEIKNESTAASPAAGGDHPSELPDGENVEAAQTDGEENKTDLRDGSVKPEADVKEEGAGEQGPPAETEESKDWLELPMLDKLDSMHLLTEWQFQNSNRLRQMMKSDDEHASWRIEPIGYDAKTNAYWLIGPDRLWLQRVPPRPPKGLKRKRPAARKSTAQPSTSKLDNDEYNSEAEQSPKRKRTQRSPAKPAARPQRPAVRSTRSRKSAPEPEPEPSGGRGSTRAAKMQANKKLDVQAKELAEFQRQAAALAAANSPTRSSRSPRKAALGTRTSARLRGTQDEDGEDDEWQQIPDEWLHEAESSPRLPTRSSARKGKGKAVAFQEEVPAEEPVIPSDEPKTGLESDAASELTELSVSEEPEETAGTQEVQHEPTPKSTGRSTRSRKRARAAEVAQSEAQEDDVAQGQSGESGDAAELDHLEEPTDEPSMLPDDFVEWDTICVTLHEWEHIAERFEKATHYLEKALYKMLTQNIVPVVTAELREAEKRKKIEEAVVHRKRSSRIATKESEKEQQREAVRKKAEEDEKLSRAKRMEARAKKEEDEREKRDKERERRRLEREEREERARQKEERARRREQAEEQRASTSTPAAGTHSAESVLLSTVPTPAGTQTPGWVLDCEICGKRGVNLDDGLPMVSCGMCSKWQHIGCHDLADQRLGRPRRDWERQQFYCQPCRTRASNGTSYIASNHQRYPVPQSHHSQSSSWSQAAVDPSIHPQKSVVAPQAYYRDPPRPQSSYAAGNGADFNHTSYPRQDAALQPGYTRTQNGLTFSHYQPENRAFTSIRNSQQGTPSPPIGHGWTNGYSSAQPQQQYGQGGGSHAGMSATSYQNTASMSARPQPDFGHGQGAAGTSQWASSSSSNGHLPPHDSAVRSAAESLAFMQGGGGIGGHAQPQQNGWHHTPGASVPHGNGGRY
ncbi:uncharacterized protein C8Q71DRAFT_833159 [Rhodofomes roseus]|uniref:Zinc finger PHD-type domain-containing protein n=1 Tax=Rhodofomes roseus TaxID=34475 RepID=A0ABQ8KL04_9APHY|nr:uncharacterized protein C8Q71DRAFT_833159 [Rhodofomes roseus]KAH9838790.1 hypothetical protein C8Q71DRAFT_833159 [Rhodofomes roseus]